MLQKNSLGFSKSFQYNKCLTHKTTDRLLTYKKKTKENKSIKNNSLDVVGHFVRGRNTPLPRRLHTLGQLEKNARATTLNQAVHMQVLLLQVALQISPPQAQIAELGAKGGRRALALALPQHVADLVELRAHLVH